MEETRGGAAPLRVSSGEIEDQEDFLIQAGHLLRPGDISETNGLGLKSVWPGRTGAKATQGTILHTAGFTHFHYSPVLKL